MNTPLGLSISLIQFVNSFMLGTCAKTFDAVIKSYLFFSLLDNFLFRNALYVLIPNLFVT